MTFGLESRDRARAQTDPRLEHVPLYSNMQSKMFDNDFSYPALDIIL